MNSENIVAIVAIVMSFVSSIVIFVFQRNWESKKINLDRERELSAHTFQFIEYFSSLLGKRLYRMRRISYSHRANSTVDRTTAYNQYQEVLFEWNDNLNPNLAKLEVYFGPAVRAKFENEICTEFVKAGKFAGNSPKSTPTKEELELYWSQLDELNKLTYDFSKDILNLFNRGDFRKN